MKSFLLSGGANGDCLRLRNAVFQQHNGFYKAAPRWVVLLPLVIILAGYLLALYWGITGVRHKQRPLNLLGLALSVLGLGYYWLGYSIQNGGNREAPGQFDYRIAAITPDQRECLYQLMKETGTPPLQPGMVPYCGWRKSRAALWYAYKRAT